MHELTAAIFQKRSLLAAIDPLFGKYLTVSVAYRGKLSMRDSKSFLYVNLYPADSSSVENAVWDFHNKVSTVSSSHYF